MLKYCNIFLWFLEDDQFGCNADVWCADVSVVESTDTVTDIQDQFPTCRIQHTHRKYAEKCNIRKHKIGSISACVVFFRIFRVCVVYFGVLICVSNHAWIAYNRLDTSLYTAALPDSAAGLARYLAVCMEQPAVVCQECTVADDVPSRAEDYFSGRHFTMTRLSWLYCTVKLLSACDYWLSAILSF